jgi:predicted ferric reductase
MIPRERFGVAIIWILCIVTVLLWGISLPFSDRFMTVGVTFTSLGQISGLLGTVLFSISMILATRLEIFEDLFDGTNRVYIVHHKISGISLILLIVHPIALCIKYLSMSVQSTLLFFLPGDNWSINYGITSLLLMVTLLILTYYINLPYQIWKFSHKFLGLAFFLGGIHGVLVTSDISRDPLLRTHMLVLIGFGILGYLWRTVFGKWLVPKFHYTVQNITPLNDSIVELVLIPSSEKQLIYTPGQFIYVSFHTKGISGESHPFSISSAPNPKNVTLLIKALGDYTNWISKIPIGARAEIEGPYGRFSYMYHMNMNQLWIAGGIGITPFLSMARTLGATPVSIDLYYCVRNGEEAVYLSELQAHTERVPGFRVIPWYTKTYGRLTGDIITKTSGDVHIRDAFICGPPALMRAMKKQLIYIGVPQSRIHSEEFGMV